MFYCSLYYESSLYFTFYNILVYILVYILPFVDNYFFSGTHISHPCSTSTTKGELHHELH